MSQARGTNRRKQSYNSFKHFVEREKELGVLPIFKMTTSTIQSSSDVSQDVEKCVEDKPEETLKFRNVPQPPSPDDNLTKGRKIAISTLLILCNSLLVSWKRQWVANLLINDCSSSPSELASAELSKLESRLEYMTQRQQPGSQLHIRKATSHILQ
jgi:hypothetical protein